MEKMSLYMFTAATITLAMAAAVYLLYPLSRLSLFSRVMSLRTVPAGQIQMPQNGEAIAIYGVILAWNALVMLALSLMFRSIASGRGPFSNMYEFTTAFVWGILLVYLLMDRQYKARILGTVVIPTAVVLLIYAGSLPNNVAPLVPALQNTPLLTAHVSVAILAYGAFAVGFGAALLYLAKRAFGLELLPSLVTLDDIGYRSVIIGFPFMALVLILGAFWANTAWGRYWGWDPKETASLVTWLLYAAYLHARTVRGWRGTPSALVLVLGFAAVLVTYFGNYFLGGLHSYAGK
ncbi:MAG TPA: c-type cytochrome biogenesis protein CcsB [Dehalococcoidia bacterium]|nr:c-type cytochrome biogenesis protein CcsB [Dehalococcoidia bacterium]